ncbi:eukaryotic translation initiation factor 5B [Anopheles ziemanni]|uniref:eukaryotic translation initiation factor 5B n=1 Tax=Anopheles coustani TaxID=139045 RepID=UPI0026598A5E|nr:eukaryotic translation initiation factor 5B [Anopheles coustani]XP_058167378.1 eukaryotic translation initiation factor 5B [Anopheles ziemanni]
MGKAKKGKKEAAAGAGLEENTSDVETVPQTDLTEIEVENRKNDKKSKKDKKVKKAASDSDNDEEHEEVTAVAESMKKLAVSKKKDKKASEPVEQQAVGGAGSDSGDGENDGKEKEVKKKKGAKSGPVGFSLLMMDDDDDDDDDGDDEKPEEVVRKQSADGKEGKGKKTKAPQTKKEPPKDDDEDGAAKGGKKGKKKKKKADEDDDEIERMLAELDMEYSGQKPAATEQQPEAQQPEKVDKKKDKKKKKDEPVAAEVEKEARSEEADDGVRLKTAAEKKKEKKERQKAAAKQQDDDEDAGKEPQEKPSVAPEVEPASAEGTKKTGKKKGKKEETAVVEESTPADAPAKEVKEPEGEKAESGDGAAGDGKKKKPNKAALAVMQERLKAIREEEERLRKEEEEKQRLEEQAEEYRLEQLRLEQEKKEKKKQREKERKERLKAEGKLLSAKQKQDRARAQAMLEALKAQGIEVPEATGERRMRPGTRIRPKKNQEANKDADDSKETTPTGDDGSKEGESKVEEKPKEKEIKESWDASDSEEEEVPEAKGDEKDKKNAAGTLSQQQSVESKDSRGSDDEDDDDDGDDGSEDDDDSDDDDDEDDDGSEAEGNYHQREAEKMRQRALDRIAKRTQDAEKKKTLEILRAAVVCVLGHVDTGKTKILDKLRRTNVQDGEAGGITQQIGATNVPAENIKEQTKFVKGFQELEFKLPGLLIIDTPGHESFSNLRSRGSSLCDIAILVVDIMHGLEPQTLESINLLKSKRTPFVVALNKIDRLYDWNTMPRKDVRDILKGQASNTLLEFTQRTKEIIVQFAEQGLNAALFYENPDPKTYVSLVPTSAITGEGMGNLLFLIVQFCQKQLAKRLMYSEDLQATVLEVKAIPGLGTTIDAILINGKLREGDTMILAGTEGPIVTQIKALLMPQPMKELRVKNAYVEHKEIMAAQGVKIAAKELEKAIAGLNLQIAQKPDEVEIFRDIVARDLKSALNSIKLSDRGVYVQASTLGSLEALLEFLRTSKIPYSGIRIGPVVKRDVMKASTMLEHENQYATILAFDVKVERDAQELADNLGVKIFQADIIYHLFDKFMAYREEIKQRKRDEFKQIAVFPCKLKILPQFVFNSRDPIVMGVIVEAGIVKEGTPITVPSREFTDLGVVTSIEANHKQIESARKGQEVCIKIEPIPSETPKMFGRHFDETDMLVSKISRQSIDACKDYFRDDLLKSDWTLMVELKKTFQIL